MATASLPAVRNGVTLVTCSGTPKTRYSIEERLKLLGATQADLDATIALFCPGRPLYATTRRGSSDPRAWTTPRGRLTEAEVLKHLTGNLTPGVNPRWVAPRSWEVTRWIGLDVDYRGDQEDYMQRCAKALEALALLGVPKSAILESETPSGGRHYRFFLTGKVLVEDVPKVFAMVGLTEASGQIEIFPRRNKGMRLPFGYLPGRKHHSQKWLRFIRAYRRGKFPKVSWLTCLQKAEALFRETLHGGAPRAVAPARIAEAAPGPAASPRRSRAPLRALGIPRRLQASGAAVAEGDASRYRELLSRPAADPSEVTELWNLGICLEGTRVEATKRLAWHLVCARGLSVMDATTQLVEWVYGTGRETSKDVRADLRSGKRSVEQETVRIVKWMADKHQMIPPLEQDKNHFSKAEVDRLRERLGDRIKDPVIVSVALNFLRFAKLHGTPTADGWSVQVAVNGVIRRWPGCRGMNYKPLINALTDCGVVRMTREKRQSANGSGRPRTYLVCVSPELRIGATMNLAEAELYAGRNTNEQGITESAVRRVEVAPYRYMRSISSTPRRQTKFEEGEARQERKVTPRSSVPDRNILATAYEPSRLEQAEAIAFASLQRRVAVGSRRIKGLSGTVPSHQPRAMIVPIVRSGRENEGCGHRLGRHRHRWLRPPPRSPTSADDEERNEP